MEFIENSVTLQDIAKATKSTVAQVSADAGDLNLYVGSNWAGEPSLSLTDAHGLVSGATRRAQDHDVAWRAHLATSEGWETAREAARSGAFQDAYDVALRRGRGSPAAAAAGHEAAREVVRDFERRTPPPEFNGKSTSTRWLTQATQRIKEVVR